MIERKREKEKIESKGAYAYDLHEAIRDVRRAFANDKMSRAKSCLIALRDICAPEIREAIQEEWDKINEECNEKLQLYRNMEFRVSTLKPVKMWGETVDGRPVRNLWVDAKYLSLGEKEEIAERKRSHLISSLLEKALRERFRVCIDCLDRHGELRKWREVEHGRL